MRSRKDVAICLQANREHFFAVWRIIWIQFSRRQGRCNAGTTKSIDDALEARELIKANILDNCLMETRDAAVMIAERTHADVVQVIGNKFVLFRQNKKKPMIELPR